MPLLLIWWLPIPKDITRKGFPKLMPSELDPRKIKHATGIGVNRIIEIVPAITEEASGPSYSVRRLSEALIEAGETVTLAALDWAPLACPPAFLRTFPLGAGPRRLGRSPSMYRWLSEQCAKGRVDVLHNHGMWQMNAIYPARAARRGPVKLIYSPRGAFSQWAMRHGSKFKRIFWPLLQAPALQQASCFHATAESEYRDIRRLGFRQPVAIIPNGIDTGDLPDRVPAPPRTLLFLGRIHVVKGLDKLLLAWRQVQTRFPDWRLVIIGSDDGYHGVSGYLETLKAEAGALGLERIEFLNACFGREKFAAYRNAELYILPSYSENFGVTVAESLAMATPAIVTKGAPWSGLVENQAGWWVDIGVEPLVVCLNEALSRSPEELAAMGRNGRDWMEREFSWDSIGHRMAATYRWLCDKTLPAPDWVRLD